MLYAWRPKPTRGSSPGNKSVATRSPRLVRPPALLPGDTVGIVAPHGGFGDLSPDHIAHCVPALTHLGLRIKLGVNMCSSKTSWNTLMTPDERIEDLHQMFRDPDVKAVFASYPSADTVASLDLIDYDLVRRNPKIVLSSGDQSALLLAVHKLTGLVTFYGPPPNVVCSDPRDLFFGEASRQCLAKAICRKLPVGKISNPANGFRVRPVNRMRTIRPGIASGRLIGGCLTEICAMLDTPYEIETRGRILFLETSDDLRSQTDHLLTLLRRGGKFDGLAGLVFGRRWDIGLSWSESNDAWFRGVIDRHLGALDVPVLFGLAVEPSRDQITLPLGVTATLDADEGTLEIRESAVS